MQLILALPALLEGRADKSARLHAPALAHLLAMAGAPAREDGGIAAALAARYGVVRQTDWPLAPIRLAALGVDPGNRVLARRRSGDARSRARRRAARGRRRRSRSRRCRRAARDAEHAFRERRARVRRAATRCDSSSASQRERDFRPVRRGAAHAPSVARAAAAGPTTPLSGGAGNRKSRCCCTSIPSTSSASAPDVPPANSLWFSEGGTLPPRPLPAPSIATFATHGHRVRARRVRGRARCTPLPSRLARRAATRPAARESIVVALDRALDLRALERAWAAPARDALAAGSLEEVTLLCDDAGDAVVWHARRAAAVATDRRPLSRVTISTRCSTPRKRRD